MQKKLEKKKRKKKHFIKAVKAFSQSQLYGQKNRWYTMK